MAASLSPSTGAKSPTTPPAGARFRLLVGLLALAGLGVATHYLWQLLAPTVSRHPQYQLTADRISITPLPAWIHSDVKSEVLRDAGLVGAISILDEPDQLQDRIREAFEYHPWVAAVTKIELRLPSMLDVQLEYRKPVAVVARRTDAQLELLPVDVAGVRLPDEDFTDRQKRYLPRVADMVGRPLVGQPWNDPRLPAAAELAVGLADVWDELQLYQITPSAVRSQNRDKLEVQFELITRGGTRVIWGAAPGRESAGESSFAEKLQRLQAFAVENGKLHTIEGPAVVDVRREILVTPRTARTTPSTSDEPPVIR